MAKQSVLQSPIGDWPSIWPMNKRRLFTFLGKSHRRGNKDKSRPNKEKKLCVIFKQIRLLSKQSSENHGRGKTQKVETLISRG